MNKTIHRFAMALSLCTLFLIFVGGLVKTTDSGLAVPDWPLSYGRLMPPMIGGIFYEHGHRMVATAVGFLTVLLALLMTFKEDRPWVRRMGWTAVGLVIFQGVLGGITVLFRLPKPISIAHACTAQTFFSVVVSLAVWTSPFWMRDPAPREEAPGKIPLHRLGFALVALSFMQLVFGATLRHTGRALPFHIGGAAMVAVLTFWIFRRTHRAGQWQTLLRRFSSALVAVLLVQLALGMSTYFILNHRFDVIPMPMPAIIAVTLHVPTGALFLGLSLVFALITYRTRPAGTAPLQTTLADYFTLTKPGISFMAGITALAGFVLGSNGDIQMGRLFHTCLGTLMAAAGAGCLNMLIERDIDGQMTRTRSRPLPSGRLQTGEVLLMGTLFSLGSVLYLAWMVNLLTAVVAALTLSVYLYIYTPLKKVSAVCVTVGAVAGALPPVMGWTAATGNLNMGAWSLFAILFFWQFPHFLSLAWLYKDDYALGGLRMLPNAIDDRATAKSIVANSAFLLIASLIPTMLGLTGFIYLAIALACGAVMTYFSVGFFKTRSRQDAKRVFLFSLLYIPALVMLMLLNGASRIWAS